VNASSTAGMIFMDVLFLIASFSYSFFPFRVLSLKKKKFPPPKKKIQPTTTEKNPIPGLKTDLTLRTRSFSAGRSCTRLPAEPAQATWLPWLPHAPGISGCQDSALFRVPGTVTLAAARGGGPQANHPIEKFQRIEEKPGCGSRENDDTWLSYSS